MNPDDITKWLDVNEAFVENYFLKKAKLTLVNKWLLKNSYKPVTDLQKSRQQILQTKFKTLQTINECSEDSQKFQKRRGSRRELRHCFSLPSSANFLLSDYIQSKVKIPTGFSSQNEFMKRKLKDSNETDFFLEIVKDIAYDLQLSSILKKISVNAEILLSATKVELLKVKKGRLILDDKASDVGGYLAKCVASEKCLRFRPIEMLQLSRVDASIAEEIRENIENMLCMPIKGRDGEVIAVLQAVNKMKLERSNDVLNEGFTQRDEKLLETYAAFCSMAICNAESVGNYEKDYERNKILLEVVHELFEEERILGNLLFKITIKARSLFDCQDCCVFLLDDEQSQNVQEIKFSKIFTVNGPNDGEKFSHKHPFYELGAIAKRSLFIEEDIKIVTEDVNDELLRNIKTPVNSLFCKPILNSESRKLGAIMLLNKHFGTFQEYDEMLFGAYSIFCGLAINNCILYDEISKASAQRTVALEVLSYHTTVPVEEMKEFQAKQIEYDRDEIHRLTFDDFSLSSDQMLKATIDLFHKMEFISHFSMNEETVCRFFLAVRKNYRSIAYHNWRHAFNVCQLMFAIFNNTRLGGNLTMLEKLGLAVACICHDVDHRGTNNAFLSKSDSALAQLYGTSATLEHHHFNQAITILNSKGHNIFSQMSSSDYQTVISMMKDAILATDLGRHMSQRKLWIKDNHITKPDNNTIRSILMTACDIGAITKNWNVQYQAANLVMEEFYEQSKKEKALQIQSMHSINMKKRDELPNLQIGWIDQICLPLYQALSTLDTNFQNLVERVLANRDKWKSLID
ncbi:DgyrCDS8673 [Dimorphilus gyrociliatus]|uniref:Phosphodiesterase n=1 Tax=Dimorphilus gyrociliatus TaxID=2664684 RepID=A0A7I8VUW8_9ANNE|nr:DgyrCDS8673 [Dimorphilus gyrociliatus]